MRLFGNFGRSSPGAIRWSDKLQLVLLLIMVSAVGVRPSGGISARPSGVRIQACTRGSSKLRSRRLRKNASKILARFI